MRRSVQSGLRKLTQITRPLALRSAGKAGSNTSLIRHVGRRSGKAYETPVVAVQHDHSVFIALPYGERTDWLKNVLASGRAEVVTEGTPHSVNRPEVVAMKDVTGYFRSKEQRLHHRFGVESALRLELA